MDERSPNIVQVTELLAASREGQQGALEELLPLVYDELHSLARRRMAAERGNHTLQATALVNEAWMRLVNQRDQNWESRSHFLAIAATVMRRVLVNHARSKHAEKRGGGREQVTLDEAATELAGRSGDMLALDEALSRLSGAHPEQARMVELRFFAGLEHAEVAQVLGVSTRTAERGWRLARAWLQRELAPAG
ncbi:MAG: RNA polymerase subunit sigma-70 [Planctomycetota bacterium]|nr:MAG: RNA polymerase subunit sigma-70 [Planctomycetota bacterium]